VSASFFPIDRAKQKLLETSQVAEFTPISVDLRQLDPARVDASAREPVAFGPDKAPVEDALARAIEGAASAQRWDVVALLAKELEARRLAAAGVMLSAEHWATRAPPK
jgi:hypothetical protein